MGLTTAAGIWLTAAIGVAVGMGRWGAAALTVVLTWIIIEYRIEKRQKAKGKRQKAKGKRQKAKGKRQKAKAQDTSNRA